MPMYEYQCAECDSQFELLRPARESSQQQPCPTCDADSERVVSTQWSAFVFRDGLARQLPDDGGYWHLGTKVSKPVTGAVQEMEHPELRKPSPAKPLSVEELEQYEYRKEQHTEQVLQTGREPVDQRSGAEQDLSRRMRARGTTRQETVKRRVGRSIVNLEYKKRTVGRQ